MKTMSDDQYQKGMEKLLENIDLKRATELAEFAGVKDRFLVKVEESRGNPYRGAPDYRNSLLEALTTQEGNALERVVNRELVEREMSKLEVAYVYAKNYVAPVFNLFVKTIKGVVYPLLPGFIQTVLDENSAKKGKQRAFYNVMSTLYDTALATGLSYRLFGLWGVLLGMVAFLANMVVRTTIYEESKKENGEFKKNYHENGTIGPLLSELVLTVPLKITSGVFNYASGKIKEINEEARKEIEAKKQLLLPARRDDEQ